jgi:hypothetical protein
VGFVVAVGEKFFHTGFIEEGVGFGHGGEGFGVFCGAIVEDAVDEGRGEAEAAVGGVDDEAGDGADVGIDEAEPIPGREFGEIQSAVAGLAVEAGVGEDGDGDGGSNRERRAAD